MCSCLLLASCLLFGSLQDQANKRQEARRSKEGEAGNKEKQEEQRRQRRAEGTVPVEMPGRPICSNSCGCCESWLEGPGLCFCCCCCCCCCSIISCSCSMVGSLPCVSAYYVCVCACVRACLRVTMCVCPGEGPV